MSTSYGYKSPIRETDPATGARACAASPTTTRPGRPCCWGTIVRDTITFGVGRNVVDTGLSTHEISYFLRNDIERRRHELDEDGVEVEALDPF